MKTQRFLSMLLVVAMVLALGVTAFAAAPTDGSITVRNATVGEDYAIYKLFDLTYETDGDDKVSTVYYTYTKTLDAEDKDDLYAALTADESPFILTPAAAPADTYVVTKKGTPTDAEILEFVAGLAEEELIAQVGDTVTADDDTVVFDNLSYGYYVVSSTLGEGIVTIDSTLKDVIVIDKNQGPTWDNEDTPHDPDGDPNPGKVIIDSVTHCGLEESTEEGDHTHTRSCYKTTVNSANYGDEVEFSIAVNATAYVGKELVTYYYITDTLAEGFGPADEIEVYVAGEKLDEDEYAFTQDENTFQVNIPFGEKFGSNAVIEVRYKAVVNADGEDVVLANPGNLNTANFTYDTDPDFDPDDPSYDPEDPDDANYPPDPYDPEDPNNPNPPFEKDNEKTTTTYVYALAVQKIDAEGTVLQGAKFSVKDAEGNAISAVPAVGEDNAVIPGVYNYSTDAAAVSQFAADVNGMLVIKGVKSGAYDVLEEVAPQGYNPLTVPVTVEAELAGEYGTKITIYVKDGQIVETAEEEYKKEYDASYNVVGITVVNNKGTELPSTGGIGTTLFYVFGAILLGGATILMITKKRMKVDE